jgi:hypothetical protein
MGKVGSSSIFRSLNALEMKIPIFHIHYLTHHYLDRNEYLQKKNYTPLSYGGCRLLWNSQFVRRCYDRKTKNTKWKIITLVREPIIRNLSAFFQNMEIMASGSGYHIQSIDYDYSLQFKPHRFDELAGIFLEKYDHETPLVFFDRELHGVLGIDVYSEEFDHGIGYKIFRGENIDTLLIRLEDLNAVAQDALNEFLGIDRFELISANVSKDKKHAEIYRRLLKTIRVPDDYIETMYGSKYARHFYTESELDAFQKKWRRGPASLDQRKTMN